MEFWVNLTGVAGCIATVCIYQQKENRRMLLWKLGSDLIWLLNFLAVGAYSAAAATTVAVLRGVVLLNQQRRWARGRAWLWIFLAVSALLSALSWKDWTTLLTAASSLACIAAFWIGKPKLTRIVSVPAAALFMLNLIFNGSVWSILNESFILLSSVVGLIRLDLRGRSAPPPAAAAAAQKEKNEQK